MKKMIYLDLDGTIYDLYNYPNWLEMLQDSRSPFFNLELLVDKKVLTKLVNKLNQKGIADFGVISWLPRQASECFENVCAYDKAEKLESDFGTDLFVEAHFLKYGTPKSAVITEPLTKDHILIDDDIQVLESWIRDGGTGIPAKNILKYLKSLL